MPSNKNVRKRHFPCQFGRIFKKKLYCISTFHFIFLNQKLRKGRAHVIQHQDPDSFLQEKGVKGGF